VHAEARRGVDLADAASDLAVALPDVRGDEVDAADVAPLDVIGVLRLARGLTGGRVVGA
jgi:hypothetical protein